MILRKTANTGENIIVYPCDRRQHAAEDGFRHLEAFYRLKYRGAMTLYSIHNSSASGRPDVT